MSANIKCEDVRDLFSPWLDGEISAGEGEMLAGHLLNCEPCRNEFDLWQRIAEALRNDNIEEEPRTDFCAGVMSRLQSEVAAKPRRKLAHLWRAPAAAAAAAVMLFAGSWGVSVALKPDKPPVVIVDNQPQPGTNTSGQGAGTKPENSTQPGDTGKAGNPGTPAGEPVSSNNEAKPGLPAPAEPGKSVETLKNTVLLSSSQRDIASTILKLSVVNTEDSKNIALAMAARYGGSGQVLTTQKKGSGDLVIIRMTVPRENGRGLVAQLSGLGGVIDRADERKDITDNYTRAANRLNEIQSITGAGMTADERGQLEAEASVLKRQIDSWDKEAGLYVIMLWLEH